MRPSRLVAKSAVSTALSTLSKLMRFPLPKVKPALTVHLIRPVSVSKVRTANAVLIRSAAASTISGKVRFSTSANSSPPMRRPHRSGEDS